MIIGLEMVLPCFLPKAIDAFEFKNFKLAHLLLNFNNLNNSIKTFSLSSIDKFLILNSFKYSFNSGIKLLYNSYYFSILFIT